MTSMRSLMNVTAKGGYNGREQSTSDTNYWVGTMGYGTTNFDTVFDYGAGFIDSWGNPTNQPSNEIISSGKGRKSSCGEKLSFI